MPLLEMTTEIHAPIERCFDLSRSIDLHMHSTEKTGEKAIGGVTTGLIGLDESVTWRAKHLGVWQELTSKVVQCDSPYLFKDVMQKGAFAVLWHEHHFESDGDVTYLKDKLYFKSPFGLIGTIFDALYLENYMRGFMLDRNAMLKQVAESADGWKQYLRN